MISSNDTEIVIDSKNRCCRRTCAGVPTGERAGHRVTSRCETVGTYNLDPEVASAAAASSKSGAYLAAPDRFAVNRNRLTTLAPNRYVSPIANATAVLRSIGRISLRTQEILVQVVGRGKVQGLE